MPVVAPRHEYWSFALISIVAALTMVGCGTTRLQNATEQLVLSDAVDRSVSQIDFRPLSGRKVYFDSSYLKTVKNDSFVNADYVISGLRQQIMAAGCLLQDKPEEAELVIEARIGTLGMDDHRLTYGVPENNSLSSAASLVAGGPTTASLPAIPEIAFARRESREGVAKVAAFAYDRTTREPVWQSGMSRSSSTARDTWVLGIGPFRQGSIRRETRFADSRLFGWGRTKKPSLLPTFDGTPTTDYAYPMLFEDPQLLEGSTVLVHDGEESDAEVDLGSEPWVVQWPATE